MEFCAHRPPSSASLTSRVGCLTRRIKETFCYAVYALFAFCFALVGTLVGAIAGAIAGAPSGQRTEIGFLRGAAVGAMSGAVFSVQVYESSLMLLRLDGSGFECLLYLIDAIRSLSISERFDLEMLNTVQQTLMGASSIFEENPNILDMVESGGLPEDSIENIPTVIMDTNSFVDASGHRASCSVCLQEFLLDETVRSLPRCHHMFHLPCIHKWLLMHGSCPLCRRNL
ncbi:hypothetical protein SAY87_017034 [Trapa incisa]|uniref:RING-type domain-containing protein n=1 Tax=Trapa incisa TaxID=236973 RepID=A0AAN7L2B5_9MYRT|nr:hypothetical protein SAY87_017034 [Trapa incisa]